MNQLMFKLDKFVCLINPVSFFTQSSWGFVFWGREDLIWRCRRHPEASFFEAVRISSNAAGVILSGAFPREDLIFIFLAFKNILKHEILTSHNFGSSDDGVGDEISRRTIRSSELTEWVDEIAT